MPKDGRAGITFVIGFEPDDAFGKFVFGVLRSAHITIAQDEQKHSSSKEEKVCMTVGHNLD